MAVTITVKGLKRKSIGAWWLVTGTFTSAAGDSAVSLAFATHGLREIIKADVHLDTGLVGSEAPKISISGGTVTVTFSNTQGKSGRFELIGR